MENSVKIKNQKQEKKNWTTRTFVIGSILGTIIGLIGAYIFIQNTTDEESTNNLTPATGLQLGLGILGALRVLTH